MVDESTHIDLEKCRSIYLVTAEVILSLKSNVAEETMEYLISKAMGIVATINDEDAMKTIKESVRKETIESIKELEEWKKANK